MLPGYFTPFRIVSNDDGEKQLGKRDGTGHREAKVNEPQSPKSNLLCPSDHSTQHSTAPCPIGREKAGHGAPKWAKEAKVLYQLTRKAWPPLPNVLFPTPLSTCILTRSPVDSKT